VRSRYQNGRVWYRGYIAKKNATDLSVTLKYDDDIQEKNVPAISSRVVKSEFLDFEEGEAIEALWNAFDPKIKPKWWAGRISKKHGLVKYGMVHHLYDIDFDDGTTNSKVHGDCIRKLDEGMV
jgi:hypothetical protein